MIEDPAAVLDEYVAHRKMRERQILKLLKAKPATIPKIVRASTPIRPRACPTRRDGPAPGQAHLSLKTEGKVSDGQDDLERYVAPPTGAGRAASRARSLTWQPSFGKASRGTTMGDTKLFIDGEWVAPQSGETFPTFAPSTGEKIADVAKAGREDAPAAVQERKAFATMVRGRRCRARSAPRSCARSPS